MEKLRFYISLVIAKMAYLFLHITKLSQGTSIIGKIVLKIYPNFLKECNNYIGTTVNITGTNGKTTTSGLISHLLKEDQKRIINNSLGANMLTGVVNAIAVSLCPLHKPDFAVIESDEAYLSKIYDKLNSKYLVVTNLFQDQLDRYGEISITQKLIQEAIDKKPHLNLVLNADDPLVASFKGSNKIYYGIENVYYADESLKPQIQDNDTFNCECGKELIYSKRFFAQQGHYNCNCGFVRPEPKYKADVTVYKTFSTIKIDNETYKVPLVGLFNAYNALAAIAFCKEVGIQNIQEHIESFKVAFGRSEVKYLNNKRTLIQLIKNPTGANEVLKTIDTDSNILIVITDNYADGRDMSWLWDVDFESLKNTNKEIVVSGTRSNDMALRLKYAEIKNVKNISNIQKAIEYIGNSADNSITILTTYTALLQISKMKSLKAKRD